MKNNRIWALSLTTAACVGAFLTYNAGAEDMKQDPKTTAKTEHLNEMQKYVTQMDGTEPPFKNEYWDNHDAGIMSTL